MPSTINADRGIVTGITGIVQTADGTGNLTLQANGVSVLTVDTSNAVTVTGAISATGNIQGSYVLGNGSQLTGVTGGLAWNSSVQTANFTATAGSGYFVNTTSSVIYGTLPSSPSLGQTVQFVDYAQTFGTNNLVINPNGNKINGSTANVTLATTGEAAGLVYSDSTRGWMAYDGFVNNPIGIYSIDYLLVAGGGGGAAGYGGGGGGAGGLIPATISVTPGTTYSIVIGGGGSGYPGYNTSPQAWIPNRGANGTPSTGFTNSAIGGGGGGGGGGSTTGNPGGSGGGGSEGSGVAGGSGTAGQGTAGGAGGSGGPNYGAGGGGGSASAGSTGSGTAGGNGGAGTNWQSLGTYYAAGGGGGTYNGGTAGQGGTGGGGTGGTVGAGNSATINTGSGGGGGAGIPNPGPFAYAGGGGAGGICIVRYIGGQRGTGGTITSSAGYTYHTFTGSGTFTA
jgi:hypothetical protein